MMSFVKENQLYSKIACWNNSLTIHYSWLVCEQNVDDWCSRYNCISMTSCIENKEEEEWLVLVKTYTQSFDKLHNYQYKLKGQKENMYHVYQEIVQKLVSILYS